MPSSRRDFLKDVTLTVGAAALPAWVFEREAAAAEMMAAEKNRLADISLSAAKRLGASYSDIRINRNRSESVTTRERQVNNVSRSQSFGFGVRVLYKGTWGFASSRDVTETEVRAATARAFEIARANSAYQRRPVTLVPVKPAKAEWRTPVERDPFAVPVDEKIAFLLKLNETALKTKGVSFVNSAMVFVGEQKFLATSDGSRIEQHLVRANPSFTVTAVDRASGDFQTRDSIASPQGLGYEYMEKYPWLVEAEQAAEEAVVKLKAKSIEPGVYDLVLHPSHLWLTIHESIGHPTELDRALWWEANYAGTSFLTPEKTGKLQIGSKLINFVADRTQKGGLATVAYDDEGVPAQRWHLVKDGLFVDWQTTRDLAPLVGRKTSYGCLHADSWGSVPFPRMPNVSLEPAAGNVSTDDVVGGVERGVMIFGRGSYSIDQQRYNFQFGGQTFWEVKNGKIVGMLRDVAYQSRTTDFWNSCDALGGQATYQLGGSFNDGKGEPAQSNAVSHGCPVARFRRVNVLNTSQQRT